MQRCLVYISVDIFKNCFVFCFLFFFADGSYIFYSEINVFFLVAEHQAGQKPNKNINRATAELVSPLLLF